MTTLRIPPRASRANARRFLGALSLLAIAASLASASATSAYYVEVRGTDALVPIRFADGDEETTDAIEVEYRVNTASLPTGVDAAAITAAFDTWTDADCADLVFTPGADSDVVNRAHWMNDGGAIYVLVYFTDSAEEWSGGPAVGHFYFAHDGTGALIGATVVLNTRDHQWATDGASTAIDVQGTVTALIGRALGVTSAMEGNATYPRYAPGDTSKRALGADDLAAIAFLYPSGEARCAAPTAAEAECDGVMLPTEDPCPPAVTTNPGDGGTAPPRDDAGPIAAPDAGVGVDAGPGGGDGGCAVAAGRSRGPGAIAGLALALIALARRRR